MGRADQVVVAARMALGRDESAVAGSVAVVVAEARVARTAAVVSSHSAHPTILALSHTH